MLTKVIVVAIQLFAELVSGFFGVMCIAAALFARARNRDESNDEHVSNEVIVGLLLFGFMCLMMRIVLGLYHRGFLMG